MNVVGYLITLANLQSFQESGGPLKDLSIRVGKVQILADDLRSQSEFPIESFKQTGYSQEGDTGKYLSQNLRNYLFKGNVDPMEEGVILTLSYTKKATPLATGSTDDKDGTLSFFLHKSGGLEEHERQNLYRYLDTIKGLKRNKRDVTVYETAMVENASK
ncbi:hypothetical protein MSG28_002739 [Choristoneura fumiferana]|uniref:Uncharacterized protein n=1 Tax=Choristoneura fumiferana TaxID=7141 RepID=A0ACC0JJ47_CHOFU|nr:hypothetical protein MSG28_002739 [Choristoneura fumiferana]